MVLEARLHPITRWEVNAHFMPQCDACALHTIGYHNLIHQIALVGDGVVQDSGRHNELLNRCEAYKTLVSRQVAQAQDGGVLAAAGGVSESVVR